MPERSSFVVGGPVPPESLAYVERALDEELFSAVTANEWVVLLGPRQSGKTSGLVRLFLRLSANGFGCSFLDLQAYGADDSYGHFLKWLSRAIAKDLGTTATDRDDLESLEDMLEQTFPERPASIVLLLDEMAALPTSWRKRFFGQLRAIFNSRARSSGGSISGRLTCVFGGTFRSEEMIEGNNSPFNVSRFITPSEFSEADLYGLLRQVRREDLEEFVPTAYESVRGQPYLSQLILSYAERATDRGEETNPVEEALRSVESGDDRHLSSLARIIKADSSMSELLPGILARDIRYDGTDDDHLFARVIGLARVESGRLVAANPLYAASFDGIAQKGDLVAPPLLDRADILVVTANDVETAALRDALAGGGDSFRVGENSYVDLGVTRGRRIVGIRCPEMGSVGAASSSLVVAEAIRDIRPSVVVMVGVAFGFRATSQRVGTVMVANEVIGYESGRIGTDREGAVRRISRGQHYNLDPGIFGRLREFADGQDEDVEFGILLSGEKLVDNEAFRDTLLEIAPEAIGGEMEAAGVCAAAQRARTPWVVVKAICDFADGNKATKKEFNQKLAAGNATEFLRRAIEADVL